MIKWKQNITQPCTVNTKFEIHLIRQHCCNQSLREKKNANQSRNSTHPNPKFFLNNITANTLHHLQRYFTQRFLTLHTTLTTLAIKKNPQTSQEELEANEKSARDH